jgi:hypothetical protein
VHIRKTRIGDGQTSLRSLKHAWHLQLRPKPGNLMMSSFQMLQLSSADLSSKLSKIRQMKKEIVNIRITG